MHHQFEVRQIDPASGHISRHTDPSTSVAHGLQSVGALVLGQLTRQGHNAEAAIGKAGGQTVHHCAGVAKDQRVGGFIIPQHVDQRVFSVVLGDLHREVFDIGVLGLFSDRFDPHGVALVGLGQSCDHAWDGGRKEQCLAGFWAFPEDKFKVFTEP